MTKGKKTFQPLTSKDICEIYNILHDERLVSFPITKEAEDKIDTLVTNINGESFGVLHYQTPEEKTVAHLYFIINDHAFTDGNKRTAVLVFQVLCRKNNLHQKLGDYNLDALVSFLEQLEEKEHHFAIRIVAEKIFSQP